MTNIPATIHLIDDDEAVLDALGLYLQSKGHTVQLHTRAEPVLDRVSSESWPACIVSDVRMPGMSGLDLQRELSRIGCRLPLILITGHGDIEMAVTAIKAGAHDFLEKPFDEKRLLEAIEAALRTTEAQHATAQALSDLKARRAELSERQQQVMDLAVKGYTNKEIGAELGISPRTVEIYRAKVMEGMGAATLADLVRIAIRLSG